MNNVYENYRILQKKACRSYWEKRILAEVGYLTELCYEAEETARVLLEEVVDLLFKDYLAKDQISVEVAMEAEKRLMPLSKKAKEISIICAAHAHIDMNWTWGFQETVALTLDTIRTMLTLMKEYPEFIFSQSQASVYQILEEYAPELLQEVKKRVQEGRWEVTASTWVEHDKNMSGGEAMAKHLLYTKKYLSNLLDIEEASMNLDFEPDTFGHSHNVPEVLRNGGITRYYHCRGYAGENIYRWKGMSGAEVLVYREPKWYVAWINSQMYEGVPAFCKRYGINKVLFVYGVGDHGGGPTRRDIELIKDMSTWPLFPELKFGTYREFYDYLEKRKEQFPVVDQELNYVFTGCYTSESRIKMANSIGETRLTEAEILQSMAMMMVPEYRKSTGMEEAWRRILFSQFHDILPGSGVTETREYALGEFQKAMARAGAVGVHAMDSICESISDGFVDQSIHDVAMGAGVGKGTDQRSAYGFTASSRGSGMIRYLALFNTTQAVRTEPVEITLWDWQGEPSFTRFTDQDGNEFPHEYLGYDEFFGEMYYGHTCNRFLVWMPVPPLGYTICKVDTKKADSLPKIPYLEPRVDQITDEPICLENNKVKAVFDIATMRCISFVRKRDGKELITATKPACGLQMITEETSAGMTAWRVGKTAKVEELNETCCIRPGKIQTEGRRKNLEYEMERTGLKVHVNVCLDEGSEFLDYHLRIEWMMLGNNKEGVPQLRFCAPISYELQNYRYTIPYGVIERPALAQDVPATGLGCAVSRDGDSALCLLCDSKYGFRGDNEGLSVNLIRSSYEPDPYPEVGTHMIHIAVGACDAEKYNLALLREQFVHPVITRSCASGPRTEDACKSLIRLDGGIISSVKEAEDGQGCIVRVYNPTEEACAMKLWLPNTKYMVYRCDFMEHNQELISMQDEGFVEYTLSGNEICSFRLIEQSKKGILCKDKLI